MPRQPGPDYPATLTKGLLELFADAETQMLRLIAKRLAKNLDVPGWQAGQVFEVHRLRRELSRLIDALRTGSEKEIARAIDAAYSFGVARAGSELAATGAVDAIAFGGVNLDAVTRLADEAKRALGSTLLPIQSRAEAIYADVVQQTAGRMLAGVGTRRDAAKLALQDWARKGITGFTDKAGRAWSLPTYAEMVARTSASQALAAGHTDRLVETGHDLAIISDAPEECELCRPWEGRVVSLTGQTPPGAHTRNGHTFTVVGTLRQAIEAGYKHPNCRHTENLYLPGITRPYKRTADPEGDKLRQQQRYRERVIRRKKREVAVLEELDPAAAKVARRNLNDYRAGYRDWLDQYGRKRLNYREQLGAR